MSNKLIRVTTAGAVGVLFALGVYALLVSGRTAHAAGTTLGYDMDPTGNTATSLGTVDRCRSVNPGEQFTVDAFINEVPAGTDLGGFNFTIGFDDTRVRLVSQDHQQLLASQPGSSLIDLSDAVPDTTSPHTAIVGDFGTGEPGPVRGVLGRYVFEALPSAATGTFALTMALPALSDPLGNDLTVDSVQDGNFVPQYGMVAVGQACPASGADLSISKSDSPDPVQAGQQLTYVLGVTNNGPFDATTVVLTDTLPSQVSFVSYTSTQGSCSAVSGTVTCSLGTILNASAASVTITANVAPGTSGTISNTASVTSAVSDPVTSNNSATETTLVGAAADLSVAVTDSPDPVLTGNPLQYTVTVFNSGPSTATGVALTDTLSSKVSYVSSSPSQGSCSQASGVVSCALGTLAPSGSATVQINVTPTTSLSEIVTNTASVTSAVGDPSASNNSKSITTFVTNGSVVTVVGVDVDPTQSPANAATSLGTIQTCKAVIRGQNFDVDVFINQVPAGRTFAGFSYNLYFDATRVSLVGQNANFLLASDPGSSVITISDPVPNSTPPFSAGYFDMGPAESGPVSGVLARYTFHVDTLAPSGLFNINLEDTSLTDPNSDPINVDQVQVATIAISDTCPVDTDGDGIPDATDNCTSVFNPSQFDLDSDGLGDACDADKDNDGVPNASDNCPAASNAGQEDFNADGVGDACDDTDGDGVFDEVDNCVFVANSSQANMDGDGLGDACDSDKDGDGVANVVDNCPTAANPGQADINSNGVGDVCEDSDSDGIFDASDNCPLNSNPSQADLDLDGQGDACDTDTDGDSVLNTTDQCLLIREDLDGIDDTDGCPDVDSGLQISRTDPVAVGISVPSIYSVNAVASNGNIMASETLALQIDSTVGSCEARWNAEVGDTYSESTTGSGPVALHSVLTIPLAGMAASEQRSLLRTYNIACISPGIYSIGMTGSLAPVAPTLEETTGVAPNNYTATIGFTAYEAADLQIQSFTGPDDAPSLPGNQLLVANGTPRNISLDYSTINNGPFTPADVIDLTSVQDVDADSDAATDCSAAPHDLSTTQSLAAGTPSPGSAAFSLNWQDASPPPTYCSMDFVHAAQVTTATARDINATQSLLNEQATTYASLANQGSATSTWTAADASSGSQSVQLSFTGGVGNLALANIVAGLPLTSLQDLQFDYARVSGGQLPDTSFIAPDVVLNLDCDNNGAADDTIVSAPFADGNGDPVAGKPGWFRADMVDSPLDSWYAPGVVPAGTPDTLPNVIAAVKAAHATCTDTDAITTISIRYGNDTATAGTARIDNVMFSGAERSLLQIDLVLDQDGDTVPDGYQSIVDNCPATPNPTQADLDSDGLGDACDGDTDGDGVADGTDNCPSVPNPGQQDFNSNGVGDACDDSDADGVNDNVDNCRLDANPSQLDTDGDTLGDACDPDDDNDTLLDGTDACPLAAEDLDGQADTDGCPDSDVSITVSETDPVSVDVGATDTFHVDEFVTNGNQATDVSATLTLRAPLGSCAANWLNQPGDVVSSGNIDTNADLIDDTYFSTIQVTLTGMTASELRSIGRDYQLACTQRGSRTIDVDVSATPAAPVVEENPANNSHLQSPTFFVYDVSDVSVQSLGATDALASEPGIQVLVGPLPPVVGSPSPVSFSLARTLANNGPFGPTDVSANTVVADVDANGDLATDCDIEPNSFNDLATIANAGTSSASEPHTITWLNNVSPPYFCSATFTKTATITTPFVRDPNSANDSASISVDFVRDSDSDGVPDFFGALQDNCALISNASQDDIDSDGLGDACDPDIDADGVLNGADNCPTVPNPGQENGDADGFGDACDSDLDNDTVPNAVDNCPTTANTLQADIDGDGTGDACDDSDGDGAFDATDNCLAVANPTQSDIDGDGKGDACDSDQDGDGVVNAVDNCATVPNPGQQNNDGDSLGDACDPDDDNDTVADVSDSCPFNAEDLDGVADTDGCPETDASVSYTANASPSVDINSPGTFTINTTVTNGNAAASLTLTLTIVSDPRTCDVHLIAQAGDTLTEFAQDTDADLIDDTFTSTIQRTQAFTASQSTSLSRNYLAICTQNGLQNLSVSALLAVASPVIEQNVTNNTQSSTVGLQAFAVADISTTSLTVPDDWPAVPANGAPETICNNNFDDDADGTVNDGCPGLAGNQVLVQAGAAPHVKFPSGVPAAPRAFVATHVLHNAGPFTPVSVTSTYAIPDVDADGDTAVDCDTTPNSQAPSVSVSTASNTVSSPPLSVSWLDAAAPPAFCNATLQATVAIATAYVRDPTAGNDNGNVAVVFVRDSDGDGVPDDYLGVVDNCPTVPNPDQVSTLVPGVGDACDPDLDFDGVDDNIDNCVDLYNPLQTNSDNDPLGNACDPDDDNDGLQDASDNCPVVANLNQADFDGDSAGDACDPDDDNDGYSDAAEMRLGSNPFDATSTPEACDGLDNDGDGTTDEGFDSNSNGVPDCNDPALNTDGDGLDNAADPDDDNDGFTDAAETYMRTNPLIACSQSPDTWPLDITGDGASRLDDITKYSGGMFGARSGDLRFDKRYDNNADGSITLTDVTRFGASFNVSC